ncbi:MAG: flippase [Candidatus Methanofastidiosia archaeon]
MSIKKVASDTGILLLSRIMISLSNVILLPLLTKNLGAVDYGIWAQAWATIFLATYLLEMGIPYSMSRFFPAKEKKEISKDFYSILFFVILVAAAFSTFLFVFPGKIAGLIFGNNILVVRVLSLIILVCTCNTVFLEILRALRKMKKYSFLLFSRDVVGIGLATIFVMSGKGIVGAMAAMLIARLIILACLIFFVHKLVSFSFPRFENLKVYLKFGIPIVPMNVSSWIVSSSDRYMIGLFLGSRFVGYYEPAYLLGQSVPFLLASVIGFALTPSISKMFDEGDVKEVVKTLSFMLKSLLTISIPFIVGSVLLSKTILVLLSTDEIAANSYQVVPLVAIGLMFYGIKVILSQTFVLEKRTKMLGATYTFSALVNIALNIVLIPYIGIMGAAISTAVSYFVDVMVVYRWARGGVVPTFDSAAIAKIVACSSLMGAWIVLYIYIVSFLPTVIPLFSGVILYFALIYMFRIFTKEEIGMIKSMVKAKTI